MYSCEAHHMDAQKQDDQHEPTYNSTGCSPEDLPEAMNDREGGVRGSGISVLMAEHDDHVDDIYIYMYIYMELIEIELFLN